MKSDMSVLTGNSSSSQATGHDVLGYPLRLVILFAVTLALAAIWLVAESGLALA